MRSNIVEMQKTFILGYWAFSEFTKQRIREKGLREFFKNDPPGLILLALKQYLESTEKFEKVDISMSYEQEMFLRDGSITGLIGKINRSEVDIGVTVLVMTEKLRETVDFCYPFRLDDFTFVTQKPQYTPQIFGIFQTFSLLVWISILAVLFAMMIAHYVILKQNRSADTIFLHLFAILMRQNSLKISTSFVETVLLYSWVIGAMIICLAHDSVFLSFLSFPPVTKIKDLSDLASAVEKGDYHCMAFEETGVAQYLLKAKQENLRVIGRDIIENKFFNISAYETFCQRGNKQNLAVFINNYIPEFFYGNFFISEDYFFEKMSAMMVGKNFCCKEMIDTFVHRMMASGIFLKMYNEVHSRNKIKYFVHYPEKDTTIRKLTLTDVAPAFIFLLCGYFISFLAFIAECLLRRNNTRLLKKLRMKKRRKVRYN